MLQTVLTTSHISVQGEFVRKLDDGRVMVRVGLKEYVGTPIKTFIREISYQDQMAATA